MTLYTTGKLNSEKKIKRFGRKYGKRLVLYVKTMAIPMKKGLTYTNLSFEQMEVLSF
jgi:hypothetical protein